MRLFIAVSLALLVALTGCSSSDQGPLTREERVFLDTTSIFLGDMPPIPKEGESDAELLAWFAAEEAFAAEESIDRLWMLMLDLAPTNRATGAIFDLQDQATVQVVGRISGLKLEVFDSEDTKPAFEIEMTVPGEETLKWMVQRSQWTFFNETAREWLRDNDFLQVCDLARDFGNELSSLTGELCRIVLEGGDLDAERPASPF